MNNFFINTHFAKLWFHQACKVLNERFRELIIPLIVLSLSGSPLITAFVLLSQQVGSILFSIPVGTIVEKRNPIFVLISSSFIQALLIFSLAFSTHSNTVQPVIIACHLFLIGVVTLFHNTAFQVIIPKIVGRKRLFSAHTLLEGADAYVTLIGPALGGFLLAQYGASITLVLCGGLLLISAVLIVMLRFTYVKIEIDGAKTNVRAGFQAFSQQAQEGVRFLYANPAQKASSIATFFLSFATIFIVLSVIFHAGTTLNLSESAIGVILSFAGLGNILGVLIMNRFKRMNWLYLLCALFIISAVGVVFILSGHFVLMCIGMLIFDGALSMGFVVQLTVQQGVTPDAFLARVRSAVYVVGGLSSILATFLAGVLTEWNSNLALVFGSFMLVLPALFLIKYKGSSVPLDQLKPM
ncbi:MFS transporter [Alkalicoccobacillus porphyridii]|uniref:MFS transporter n=1 Tax=Alkalicoccobacillus porphyridii TaxID=2597270 RepID=A0A554A2L4_9BACI|nr:MFS transporter [Alkalicoccobacillus porphyridii]TSB47927.1 MFS transporter [Alkalicoccobacillus porphyridii]